MLAGRRGIAHGLVAAALANDRSTAGESWFDRHA